MLADMAYQRTEGKIVVQARVDAKDVEKLDALAEREDTVQFRRSRSELIGFAIHEYVERHALDKKKRAD